MLLNTLLNSLIQIFVFALVPFLVWCLTARKRCSFPSYIGLKCIRARSRAYTYAGSPSRATICRNALRGDSVRRRGGALIYGNAVESEKTRVSIFEDDRGGRPCQSNSGAPTLGARSKISGAPSASVPIKRI